MPRIQIINEAGHDRMAYKNLLNYVARPDKCISGFWGMTNVCNVQGVEPKKLVEQQHKFLMEYYGNYDGRYAMHFIIEFAPSESAYLDHQKALDIAYFVAISEFPQYICYFAVHDHCYYEGTQNISYHIDMMLALINIYDGKSYGFGIKWCYKIGCDLIEYMKNFMPEDAINKLFLQNGRT